MSGEIEQGANAIINAEHGGKLDREGYNAYIRHLQAELDNSRPP